MIKKFLVLFLLLVALPIWAAGTAIHTYDTSISSDANYCGPLVSGVDNAPMEDSSGVIYWWPTGQWLLVDQQQISVYDSCTNSPSVGPMNFACNDTEGISLIYKVNPSWAEGDCTADGAPYACCTATDTWDCDMIVAQAENSAYICLWDMDEILAGTPSTNTTFNFPTTDGDCNNDYPADGGREGVAFIPNAGAGGNTCSTTCQSGIKSGVACSVNDDCNCRFDGYFIVCDQSGASCYKYCMHPTNTTLDCLTEVNPKASCGGSEIGGLDYDYATDMLYVLSDAGNSICYVDPDDFVDSFAFAGSYSFPSTEDAFEGMTVGDGKIALVSDCSDETCPGSATNGLWIFEDLYCGDGKISSAEACDDLNQTDSDGCAGPECTIETSTHSCAGAPSYCATHSKRAM